MNKTNYEKCVDKGFISNITRGGRDVFQLLEAKTYYFLCGRGFCFHGMKVDINVEPLPPDNASLIVPEKACSTRKMNQIKLSSVLLVLAMTWIFL